MVIKIALPRFFQITPHDDASYYLRIQFDAVESIKDSGLKQC